MLFRSLRKISPVAGYRDWPPGTVPGADEPVSAWEIGTKNRLGKWPGVERLVEEFSTLLRRSRFVPLPLSVEHARLAGTMDGTRRDPFDRMLIAQSREEKAALISCDAVFQAYGMDVIWA